LKKYQTRYQRTFEQLLLLILLLMVGACSSKPERHVIIEPSPVHADDIRTVKDIPQTHKEFLARFLPEIHTANNAVLQLRNQALDIQDTLKENDHLSLSALRKLNTMLQSYRLEPLKTDPEPGAEEISANITHLLKRADIIPVKLVMAQAIIESGWGSSKFAREGNNYFGVHCYTEGCGVKPAGNDSASFYVKAYPSEIAGIEDYFWILNTGHAYKELRKTRLELREEGKPIDALAMAKGLASYSIKGDEYIKMVSNIITNYLPQDTEALLTTDKP